MREKILIPPREYMVKIERRMPTERPSIYSPFKETDGEVAALAPLGKGYRFHITGLLHDKDGFPTSDAAQIDEWFNRVFNKFEKNIDHIYLHRTYMVEDADVLVISYGISTRAARRAVTEARNEGIKAGLLQLLTIWPVHEKLIETMCRDKKMIVVPEMNRGQMVLEIERILGKEIPIKRVNKSNGHILQPEPILEVIKSYERENIPARR
jgi:2-oxoglutarate ferredoxin oxidoreductase subunit alpha